MLYENIRLLREEKGYTQNEIAEILNIKQQQYQRYESGKIEIPIKFVKQLATLYKVSTDYLLECSSDIEYDKDTDTENDEYSFRKITDRLADAYEEAERRNENYKKVQTKLNRETSKLLLNSPSTIEWLLKRYKSNILRYTRELEDMLYKDS